MTIEPWEITHGVGTGDFFNAESFWSDEEKAALTTVHHCWRHTGGSDGLIEIMRLCPDFAHVEHKATSYPTELIPGSIETLRDHAIEHRLEYRGSSFLRHRLECTIPAGLPERFCHLQPDTPKNGRLCDRWIREREWPGVIGLLESWDLVGLVVNSPGGKATVPRHPRLIDWTGRTSMAQSVEVLKRSSGYIGVDSCFAILAAQLFGPDRLAIRSTNPYLLDRPEVHYPPHREFPFLYPAFDLPPYPVIRPDRPRGVIVETRANVLMGNRTFGYGCRVELDECKAAELVKYGKAAYLEASIPG